MMNRQRRQRQRRNQQNRQQPLESGIVGFLLSVIVVAAITSSVVDHAAVSAFTVTTVTTPIIGCRGSDLNGFSGTTSSSSSTATSRSSSSATLHAVPPGLVEGIVATTNNNAFWISTIDSDIASIPTNEFAPIFAGGIAVMFGGLVSTFLLGTIIDKGDLYADLAAESYIQAADDPEFWKNLSAEETLKAKEMLIKIKETTNGSNYNNNNDDDKAEERIAAAAAASVLQSSSSSSSKSEDDSDISGVAAAAKASDDMFSDYD